jgi:hypothetical protein
MTTKRLKRTESKSFVRKGLVDNIDGFVNIPNTTRSDIIFDFQSVEKLIKKFVSDLSQIAPMDQNNLRRDIFDSFERNLLIPPLIENPCRICSKFICQPNPNQLCGVTRCLNCSSNHFFENTKYDKEPITNPTEKVP